LAIYGILRKYYEANRDIAIVDI